MSQADEAVRFPIEGRPSARIGQESAQWVGATWPGVTRGRYARGTGMLRVGDRAGDYEIVESIRSGGMATLFLGRRVGAAGFARPVAIKVVHDHLAEDPTFVRMFVDEAMLVARIQHPNVVHVEALGEHEGTYFIAMEYVDGCSLAALLNALSRQQRRLATSLAVYIAIQIAEGLHAAHETTDAHGRRLGVVHRDVSPQNVLVSPTGHVKIIDFGIAKSGERAPHAGRETVRGKFRYMAPEQARGAEVDRRADVFALGVVLWEMLALQPFIASDASPGDVPDLVARARPPGSYAPDVPPALDRAVMHALSVDPANRTPDARTLRDELARAVPDALAFAADHLSSLYSAVSPARSRITAMNDASGPATATQIDVLTRPVDPVSVPIDAVSPASTSPHRARAIRAAGWLSAMALIGVGATVFVTRGPHAASSATPRSVPTPRPRVEQPVPPVAPAPALVALPSAPAAVTTHATQGHAHGATRPHRTSGAIAAPSLHRGHTVPIATEGGF